VSDTARFNRTRSDRRRPCRENQNDRLRPWTSPAVRGPTREGGDDAHRYPRDRRPLGSRDEISRVRCEVRCRPQHPGRFPVMWSWPRSSQSRSVAENGRRHEPAVCEQSSRHGRASTRRRRDRSGRRSHPARRVRSCPAPTVVPRPRRDPMWRDRIAAVCSRIVAGRARRLTRSWCRPSATGQRSAGRGPTRAASPERRARSGRPRAFHRT
jgi:hypothetical protein